MFDGDFVDEEEAGLEEVGDALDFGGDEVVLVEAWGDE